MKTKKYVEYMVEETKKILAIDSPSVCLSTTSSRWR